MKMRLAVANKKPFVFFGESMQLTDEILNRLAETCIGKPVLKEFDQTTPPVGVIEAAEYDGDTLYVTVDMFAEQADLVGYAVAPGYIDPGYESTEFGLTRVPIFKDPITTIN